MTKIDWLELKNGSDIRGTAIDGNGEKANLTPEAVDGIIRAFCLFFAEKSKKTTFTIAVGHDSRLSAKWISECTLRAITESGANALFTGLSSTPSMFMLLQDGLADASVMITASHLPYNKNGLKFFTKESGLESSDISRILELAANGQKLSSVVKGTIKEYDYLSQYAENLVKFFREKTGCERPLKGKKIVVDAGNGAGGFYADKVLTPLGADTHGSQFLNPDGNFPNHIPNPENKDAMASICECVKKNRADFGIIFDTDVDRAGAVDKHGEEINRNRLIALISAILLSEKKGAVIVTDSVTSDGLTEFIQNHGGVHRRFRRGYKNVINESIRLNAEGKDSPLAIETSGHAALRENYFLDDGAYLVTRILITLANLGKDGKDISDLISDLPEPIEAAEARLGFTEEGKKDFKKFGNDAIEAIRSAVETRTGETLASECCEGVRINFDKNSGDGWALVRMSLHEPIVPVNFESNQTGGCKIIANRLYDLISSVSDKIDLANLEKFIKNA